ncbi:MAG: CDP-alcohol phosphatidyltransferase family protein [Acidimicrobiia bacterium]|nr:MAG: CDP-alcohol phosphatidyltransferase family protein [Acidimicrobiia bacterium]
MIETYVRGRIEPLLDPLGRGLAALRLTPTKLTLGGLAVVVVASWLIAAGDLALGGWLFLAGSALDGLDGTVARVTGTASRKGALIDSVADRAGEIAVWGALATWLAYEPRWVLLCVLALGGALLTSYLRAKAEAIGADGRGGIVARGERVILLTVGLVSGWLVPVLVLAALLIWATVAQRFLIIWKRLEA